MKILITDGLAKEGQEIFLEKGYEVVDRRTKAEELEEAVKGHDALVIRSATKVTKDVIEAADRLKIIGRAGVGVDNVDLEAALEHGIVVKNAPDGNTNAAAELTVALMMAIARHIPQAYRKMTEMTWHKKQFEGVELYGKTVGIIGYGRIGARVAEILSGFRARVVVYDSFRQQGNGVEHVDLGRLLKESDFVTLHTPKTKGALIGENEISKMKQTAYLINASRGGNVDENALYIALTEGRIAGAAFDVYEKEGKEGQQYSNRLFELPNFIGVPHIGASTKEAQRRTAIQIAEGVIGYLEQGKMDNAVNIGEVSDRAYKGRTCNLFVLHANRPGMIAAITKVFGSHDINIEEVPSATAGEKEITVVRAQQEIPESVVHEIREISGVYRVVG